MHKSGGGKQRVDLSEEARERQQIRDRAVVLQQTSQVAAHQVLASKSTAASSLTVELLAIGSRVSLRIEACSQGAVSIPCVRI